MSLTADSWLAVPLSGWQSGPCLPSLAMLDRDASLPGHLLGMMGAREGRTRKVGENGR